jgi:hypothetical protein
MTFLCELIFGGKDVSGKNISYSEYLYTEQSGIIQPGYL